MKVFFRSYNILLPLTIFFIALTIRVVYFAQIKGEFFFETSILDAQYYDDWANGIVTKGDWLSRNQGLFVVSPGYTYFLAIIYKIFGRHVSLIALTQIFLGSLSCVLVFLIASKVSLYRPEASFLRRSSCDSPKFFKQEDTQEIIDENSSKGNKTIPAIISGLLAATYSMSIFYEGVLLKSTLIVFMNLLMLYCLLIGIERNNRVYIMLAGLCLGLSVHLRPNILGFIVFLFVFLYVKGNRNNASDVEEDSSVPYGARTSQRSFIYKIAESLSSRARIKVILHNFTPFIIGVLIILVPMGLRNYFIANQFVLTTAHGGMNLYTGNNPSSVGPYWPLPFAEPNIRGEIEGFFAEAQRRTGHALTLQEADKFWYEEAWKFINERPKKWLMLVWRKALIFLNNYETPINLDFYAFRQVHKSIVSFPLVTYGVVVPLGLWGMIVSGLKNNASKLLTLYITFYFFVSAVFFVVSEYRYPVAPAFAIFAGQGIYWSFEKIKNRRYFSIALGVIFLVSISWLVNKDIYKDWFHLDSYKERILANSYFSMGAVYEANNIPDKAKTFYLKAIAIQPMAQAGPFIKLGNLYARQGLLEEAKRMFESAINVDPNSAEAYIGLGGVYLNQKNYQEAELFFQKAVLVVSQKKYGLSVR